jgi:hypothetical protein
VAKSGGGGDYEGLSRQIDKSGQAAIGKTKRTVASYRFNLGHTVDYRTEGQAKRRRGTFLQRHGRGYSKSQIGKLIFKCFFNSFTEPTPPIYGKKTKN